MILGTAADHPVNVVAGRLGCRAFLQNQDSDPLATRKAIGILGEGLTSAVYAEQPGLPVANKKSRSQQRVYPADDRHRARVVLQGLHAAMNCDERTRAGALDGPAGAMEVEQIAHPVRACR